MGNEKQIYYYKCAYSRCNYVAAREK
ncbi:polysaccharide pyruvyl transferase family protein, partial [Salmonella enterica subsp. enterica serovar Mississippi]|nr:polysaccharide pyruvyl transferase family protein [Salmonella enterica]EBV0203001.1 polysaccharide pyruvyl transferase family protein [Salmonella enterica subsp. enterica serovar Napoli]ECY6132391.1 polysaccharide pyruvyl transferase family protein [Salmonella enterica subsp. enterica serovar Mississippi]EDN5160905.1 polysaccharide pyruvyl transferase family protein [Salmonella enterica subsp. enterica serovar Typhi]EDQ0245600.1 polysaccharide pyruvyl transferase family protein [Salmonella e